jgi:hypothetical protein
MEYAYKHMLRSWVICRDLVQVEHAMCVKLSSVMYSHNSNKFYLAVPYDLSVATKYREWVKAAMIIVKFLDYSTNLAQNLRTPFGRP